MSEKPRATQRVREKFGTKKLPNASTGVIEKVRVPKGKETVRTGFCWQHRRHSSAFVGINEYGWVFFCPGIDDKSAPAKRGDPVAEELGHYFINQASDAL